MSKKKNGYKDCRMKELLSGKKYIEILGSDSKYPFLPFVSLIDPIFWTGYILSY